MEPALHTTREAGRKYFSETALSKISDCLKVERESPDHVIRLVRNNNFLRASCSPVIL